jgi:hypothetical protein
LQEIFQPKKVYQRRGIIPVGRVILFRNPESRSQEPGAKNHFAGIDKAAVAGTVQAGRTTAISEGGFMKKVTYLSKVRIERLKGPDRLAYLPAEKEPVRFGVHGAVAEHYGLTGEKLPEAHATTLDYVVAAAGG